MLAIWQSHRGLSPTERIELMFFDFMLPPPVTSHDEYEATLKIVSEYMRAA